VLGRVWVSFKHKCLEMFLSYRPRYRYKTKGCMTLSQLPQLPQLSPCLEPLQSIHFHQVESLWRRALRKMQTATLKHFVSPLNASKTSVPMIDRPLRAADSAAAGGLAHEHNTERSSIRFLSAPQNGARIKLSVFDPMARSKTLRSYFYKQPLLALLSRFTSGSCGRHVPSLCSPNCP